VQAGKGRLNQAQPHNGNTVMEPARTIRSDGNVTNATVNPSRRPPKCGHQQNNKNNSNGNSVTSEYNGYHPQHEHAKAGFQENSNQA
jgi:hypothetical protein